MGAARLCSGTTVEEMNEILEWLWVICAVGAAILFLLAAVGKGMKP